MLLTTSRSPSLKTRAFARDLSKSFPQAEFFSRGKTPLKQLIEKARFKGKKFLLIVAEKKREPELIEGLKITEAGWQRCFEARIKLLKSRKELSQARQQINELKLDLRHKEVKKLMSLLEITSSAEAETVLEEKNRVLKFWQEKKELGPRFSLEMIKFE